MAVAGNILVSYIDNLMNTKLRLKELENWLKERGKDDKMLEISNFPETIIKSFFLSIYADLDACMSEIANSLYKQYRLCIPPDDLRGKGVQRSINYLKKIALIPIPDDLKTYEYILVLMKLRNHYAHDGKPYVLKDSSIHKAALKFETIEIKKSFTNMFGEHVNIKLTFDFLRDVCETVWTFYVQIDDFINDHFRQRVRQK